MTRPRRRRTSARRYVTVATVVASTFHAVPARAADPDPWFGKDKALHATLSGAIAASTYGIASAAGVPARGHRLLLGGGVALTLGAAKEVADLAGLGDPSWKDFAWDVIGTAVGLGLAWGVDMLIGGVGDTRPALVAPPKGTTPSSAVREVVPFAAPAPGGLVVRF
ncbi:MAG: hypothetical protein U0169_16665 [Polyangiaceae bacterium]